MPRLCTTSAGCITRALVEHSKNNTGVLHEFFGKEEEDELLSRFVYFASFSRERDRLDLWRAYGQDAGCCIVIPLIEFPEEPKELAGVFMSEKIETKIKMTAAEGEFQAGKKESPEKHPRMCLYRVLYTNDEKKKALEALKEPLEEIKKIKDKKGKPEANKEIDKVVRIILSDILYLYKNKEYSAKKELRMVSTHLDSDTNMLIDEGNRETRLRHLFVETRPFIFAHPEYEIIIGPRAKDKYATQREIEHLLHKHNFAGNVNVRMSDVPYR